MKKAIISNTVELLEGGCNVCGIIEDVNYTLTIEEKQFVLEELSVAALVMTIAMEKGFKREYKMDVIDDYVVFNKGNETIVLKEEFDFLTYTHQNECIQTANQIQNKEELAKQVNTILTNLFSIEAYTFIFDTNKLFS